jgi:hypothetical protein
MTRKWPAISLTLVFAVSAAAQSRSAGPTSTQPATSRPTPEGPRIVRLALSPAAELQPALKYSLLPTLLDQTPGDAMTMYYTAMDQMEPAARDEDLQKKLSDWQDLPADRMPWKEARQKCESFTSQIELLDLAARCRTCQWNLPIEKQGISTLLPSLSRWRLAGKMVQVQARLAVQDRRFDKVMQSMQTGLGMARHVADGPTLIQELVGTAIAKLMLQPAEDWIGSPDSPNLYWALAALPQPFIVTAPGQQGESAMLFGTFPDLRRGMTGDLTGQQWNQLLRTVIQTLSGASDTGGSHGMEISMAQAMLAYPQAKQYFRSQGYTPEQIEAMPAGKAILLYAVQRYQVLMDDMFKWWTLPFWQAWPGMQETDRRVDRAARTQEVPILGIMIPSLTKGYVQTADVDRRFAALRTIEAIRVYAAAHDGELPASLDEIQEVPVPINPMTGQAFPYRLEGGRAVLEVSSPAGMPSADWGVQYELTLRK